MTIVHTHNVAPWLYAGLAARLAGAAVCHTEHSHLFPDQRALKRAERVLGRLSKAVICDGEDVRRQLVEEQGLSPRNVVTIHNGVDTALYGAARRPGARGRRALGLPRTRRWWAPWPGSSRSRIRPRCCGRSPRWRRRCPRRAWCWWATARSGPALEEQARQPALAGKVLFLGRRADVAEPAAAVRRLRALLDQRGAAAHHPRGDGRRPALRVDRGGRHARGDRRGPDRPPGPGQGHRPPGRRPRRAAARPHPRRGPWAQPARSAPARSSICT